jgi:hypothetical protein
MANEQTGGGFLRVQGVNWNGMEGNASAAVETPEQTDEMKARVSEAKDLFKRCQEWESNFRNRFIDDLKFSYGDAYNGYQWPNAIRKSRDVDERPCLTINKTNQHCLQIINDARQHKPGVSIRPTGNGATFEAAQALEGIVRHIEYISRATQAYDTAVNFQVRAGKGYIRVATDWKDPGSLDQEIYIRRVVDPLTIYMDPDAKEADKSDARYAFVFDNVPREQFDTMFPEYANHPARTALDIYDGEWNTLDHIRICEYWYFNPVTKHLLRKAVVGGAPIEYEKDDDEFEAFNNHHVEQHGVSPMDDPMWEYRKATKWEVRRAIIVGSDEVQNDLWPGMYIPIVPVIGEEYVIDGLYDCHGHTRCLIDPQRMYNYWSSAAVEYGALASKSPWVAAEESIEGHETYWNTANRVNYGVLTYNHLSDDGSTELPAPQRPPAPEQAPLYLSGMQVTASEMMMVSGQYQSQMGEQSNERSGKAIQERQRQGDNATYQYIDGLGIAIAQVGRIILDLIPKIYDTKRIVQILAEDGKSFDVEIDPDAAQAWAAHQSHEGEVIRRIMNPEIGYYAVQADVGPDYGTQRQQAFDAMQSLLTESPGLTSIIGDILLKAADFPMADEAAERLRRMVPKQALGQGPSQAEQELQMQLQQATGMVQKLSQQLVTKDLALKGKDEMRDIDSYEAETKRFAALKDMLPMDPEGLKSVIQQLVHEAMTTHPLTQVISANAAAIGQGGKPLEQPPMEGAQRGSDGHWYLQHAGGYAKLEPMPEEKPNGGQ